MSNYSISSSRTRIFLNVEWGANGQARWELGRERREHSVTDRICTELHWLDIPSRVAFKLCVLAYRCIHGSAPSYLARFFTPVSAIAGRSQLWSAATGVFFVPRSHISTIGPCHGLSLFPPLCLEQPPGWSSLSWPLSSNIPEKTEDLSV